MICCIHSRSVRAKKIAGIKSINGECSCNPSFGRSLRPQFLMIIGRFQSNFTQCWRVQGSCTLSCLSHDTKSEVVNDWRC